MTTHEIKLSVQALKTKYDALSGNSLLDKILIAYSSRILNTLASCLTQPIRNATLANAIQTILVENWVLVNGTALCYTAIPTHDITILLCKLTQFVADAKKLNPVEVLMPGMSVESYRNGYPDINTVTNLNTLLQTHVSGNGGTYLLPVKLITELDLSAASMQLGNPYFDVFNPMGNGFVDAEEYKRLVTHSALTQAVFNAKQEYERLTRDTSTLLGQLKQLCRQLGVNSAGNFGEEENAGIGAYPAIINFMEYYNKLNNTEKNKIPENLSTEINTLLTLVTDKTQNIDATENYNTCIATRRNKLISTMFGHDAMLNQISLSRTRKASLINDASLQFDIAKTALAEAIEKNAYTEGYDRLNFSTQMMSVLNIKLNINSLADLEILKTLTPQEIRSVCTDAELKRQIVEQLRCLENLVIFIMEMPVEKLSSFLQANSEELVNEFIQSPKELNNLLMSLDLEKCAVVITALKDSLSTILMSPEDLTEVLDFLPLDNCVVVIAALKDSLSSIIRSGKDLKYVLEILTQDQCTALCDCIKDHLPDIINSDNGLSYIIKLEPMQQMVVYEAMQNRWHYIIMSETHLIAMLERMTQEQASAVCHDIMDRLPNIIKSSQILHRLLGYIMPTQHAEVCDVIKAILPNIIRSRSDLYDVLWYINPILCIDVCDAIKNQLPDIITSVEDLVFILHGLNRGKRVVIYNAIKSRLPDIIHSCDDLDPILKYLPRIQRTAIFDTIQDRLPYLIKSGTDLIFVLQHLRAGQFTAVCDAMKDKWHIVKSTANFQRLLPHLTHDQCTFMYIAIKDRLPTIFKKVETKQDNQGTKRTRQESSPVESFGLFSNKKAKDERPVHENRYNNP